MITPQAHSKGIAPVVDGDAPSQAWLEENKAHDGDPTWDENRLRLPAGVEQVSNQCHVTKMRQ